MNESHKMNESHNTISLNIMSKQYKVKCPLEKVSELRESAQFLEEKMRGVAQSGKVLSPDRVAIIAALNIVHEFLAQKKQINSYVEAMGQRIEALRTKIENTLASVD